MSRLALILFLWMPILSAFAAAGHQPLQKINAPHTTAQTFFSQPAVGTHCPGDIQSNTITVINGQQPAQQRTVSVCEAAGHGSTPGDTFPQISISTALVEWFDNNRLSHNYPAHNFW